MPYLHHEVSQALINLAACEAPSDEGSLLALVQDTLKGFEIDVSRVSRSGTGRFLVAWHRKGGALTEETTFALMEPVLAEVSSTTPFE